MRQRAKRQSKKKNRELRCADGFNPANICVYPDPKSFSRYTRAKTSWKLGREIFHPSRQRRERESYLKSSKKKRESRIQAIPTRFIASECVHNVRCVLLEKRATCDERKNVKRFLSRPRAIFPRRSKVPHNPPDSNYRVTRATTCGEIENKQMSRRSREQGSRWEIPLCCECTLCTRVSLSLVAYLRTRGLRKWRRGGSYVAYSR